MYLIVNTTKKIVSIGDLKVSLEAHQMVDLDKWKGLPMKPEHSNDLKANERSGNVKVMKHDRHYAWLETTVKSVPLPVSEKKEAQVQTPPVLNEEKIAISLMGPLQEFIRSEISKLKQPEAPPKNSQVPQDQSEILSAIGQLHKIISKKSNSNYVDIEEVNVEVDEDKMVEMHAKTVSKLARSIEGDISHETVKEKDSSISDNVNELDGLL